MVVPEQENPLLHEWSFTGQVYKTSLPTIQPALETTTIGHLMAQKPQAAFLPHFELCSDPMG